MGNFSRHELSGALFVDPVARNDSFKPKVRWPPEVSPMRAIDDHLGSLPL
jgi:hypothetical protein